MVFAREQSAIEAARVVQPRAQTEAAFERNAVTRVGLPTPSTIPPTACRGRQPSPTAAPALDRDDAAVSQGREVA